jgi:hypothetical protein
MPNQRRQTAWERRKAERDAGNSRYIAQADDAELAQLLTEGWMDDDTARMIRAEQARRAGRGEG